MVIRAVLWDIDDTLFDYSGAEAHGIIAHLEDEGLLAEFDSAEQALVRWRQIMLSAYDRFLAGELTFTEQRRLRARTFLDFLDAPLSDEQADAWFAGYGRRSQESWALFPDVLPALEALDGRYRHGVVSNSSAAHQDAKLRRLGVRERFSCLVCSDELGVAKPDPRIFLAGCAALGLAPHEVAYVGDKLDVDAEGAVAAGLRGVWLDRTGAGGPVSPGVRRIGTLHELAAELRETDGNGGARGAAESRFGAPPPIR
jgi:putative hydrolase of the HAD superfamily